METEFLNLFRQVIYRKLGIHFTVSKSYLLESKLNRIISREGYRNIAEFYNRVRNNDPKALEQLTVYMTTNHTSFFREPDQFDVLAEDILRGRHRRPIIWSAACSTGEEPYSIAITLLEAGVSDFLIMASDIDPEVLATAASGVYRGEQLEKLPCPLRTRYFPDEGGDFRRINDTVRKKVRFKRLNLMDAIRFEQPVDYIFCRNVMIYFDRENQKKCLGTLARNLHPEGLLFIGHSESLLYTTDTFVSVSGSAYRLRVRQHV